jgi:VanZ family protein
MRIKFLPFIPAIAWLISSIILLSLPGNNLPEGSFNFPYFDKYVHFIMFFMLTVLFCYPITKWGPGSSTSLFNQIAVYVIVYGIIMEFVQKHLVPNRSFDVVDILFDSLGSLSGLAAIRLYNRKKIGPNRNRGRNQN